MKSLADMTILCGIDFSDASSKASSVAARMAARLGTSLTLVHAVNPIPRETGGPSMNGLLSIAEHAMEKRASALIDQGAKVFCRTGFGTAEQLLEEVHAETHASMMVLSATGRGHSVVRPLGSSADRLCHLAWIPTIALRSTRPFEEWLDGKRPLKVVVGLDFGGCSSEAWRWAQELSSIAPVELMGTHAYWPPDQAARLGLHGHRSVFEADHEIEQVLLKELETRYPRRGDGSATFKLQAAFGRSSDSLLAMAAAEKADLVVVGSRFQGGLSHLWEGSTSHQTLKFARCAVACVPLAPHAQLGEKRPISTVLVATDFSELGNSAIPYALSQVSKGGRVYLAHVAEEASWGLPPGDLFTFPEAKIKEQRSLEDRLQSLVPTWAYVRDIRADQKVINCRDPIEGIVQAAERLNVDLICMATHGRTGLKKALLGSVAEGVLQKSLRPVLLVRAPRP